METEQTKEQQKCDHIWIQRNEKGFEIFCLKCGLKHLVKLNNKGTKNG